MISKIEETKEKCENWEFYNEVHPVESQQKIQLTIKLPSVSKNESDKAQETSNEENFGSWVNLKEFMTESNQKSLLKNDLSLHQKKDNKNHIKNHEQINKHQSIFESDSFDSSPCSRCPRVLLNSRQMNNPTFPAFFRVPSPPALSLFSSASGNSSIHRVNSAIVKSNQNPEAKFNQSSRPHSNYKFGKSQSDQLCSTVTIVDIRLLSCNAIKQTVKRQIPSAVKAVQSAKCPPVKTQIIKKKQTIIGIQTPAKDAFNDTDNYKYLIEKKRQDNVEINCDLLEESNRELYNWKGLEQRGKCEPRKRPKTAISHLLSGTKINETLGIHFNNHILSEEGSESITKKNIKLGERSRPNTAIPRFEAFCLANTEKNNKESPKTQRTAKEKSKQITPVRVWSANAIKSHSRFSRKSYFEESQNQFFRIFPIRLNKRYSR